MIKFENKNVLISVIAHIVDFVFATSACAILKKLIQK
jgi:hypothetical protein